MGTIRHSNSTSVSGGLDRDIAKPRTFTITQTEDKRHGGTLTLDKWGTAEQLDTGDLTTVGLLTVENTGDATIYLGQNVTSGGVNATLELWAGERFTFRTNANTEWWASSIGATDLDYEFLGA